MTQPPDRIYDWLNGHLSIARFYGGVTLYGEMYVIAEHEPGQPLVRHDVLKREKREARKKAKPKPADPPAAGSFDLF